jgi:hypothetical protein
MLPSVDPRVGRHITQEIVRLDPDPDTLRHAVSSLTSLAPTRSIAAATRRNITQAAWAELLPVMSGAASRWHIE